MSEALALSAPLAWFKPTPQSNLGGPEWTADPASCDGNATSMADPKIPHGDASTADPQAEPAAELTIDELSAETKVPSRTIRFYQSKKALPAPTLRGRVAYYDRRHVERLELIATLQDRGLRIDAIRDLVAAMERGDVSVTEWLGLSDELLSPWGDDQPRVVTEAELLELAGGSEARPRPGLIAELERFGQIERQGARFLVRSPTLLGISLKLEEAGIDQQTAAGAAEILRKHLSRAASDLARFFVEHAGSGFGREGTAEELGQALSAIRPLGVEAVKLIFSKEIERELRVLTESGKAARIPLKAKKRRR